MVNLLFVEDDDILSKPGVVRTIYDPTAGTGGMLSIAEEYLSEHNEQARLVMNGQELNPESYAICKADMLIKGQDVSNIVFGNTLSEDGHAEAKFDYMLSNPPFGVEWKKVEKDIRAEHEQKGFNGRFGPGLPRVSDGSLLFLMHLISKILDAIMDAFDAHSTMSRQALDSQRVRDGIKDILLGPGRLWEGLREKVET